MPPSSSPDRDPTLAAPGGQAAELCHYYEATFNIPRHARAQLKVGELRPRVVLTELEAVVRVEHHESASVEVERRELIKDAADAEVEPRDGGVVRAAQRVRRPLGHRLGDGRPNDLARSRVVHAIPMPADGWRVVSPRHMRCVAWSRRQGERPGIAWRPHLDGGWAWVFDYPRSFCLEEAHCGVSSPVSLGRGGRGW